MLTRGQQSPPCAENHCPRKDCMEVSPTTRLHPWVPLGTGLPMGYVRSSDGGHVAAPTWAPTRCPHAQTSNTSLPEGIEGVGSPDVGAQHVKGALLVAILGRMERWLHGARLYFAPSVPHSRGLAATHRPLASYRSALGGRKGRFQPLGHKAVDNTERTTCGLMLAPSSYPTSAANVGVWPPRNTDPLGRLAFWPQNSSWLTWGGTSKVTCPSKVKKGHQEPDVQGHVQMAPNASKGCHQQAHGKPLVKHKVKHLRISPLWRLLLQGVMVAQLLLAPPMSHRRTRPHIEAPIFPQWKSI